MPDAKVEKSKTVTASYDPDTLQISRLAHSETEITASIPAAEWEKYRAQAVKSLNGSVSIDGFRKGNVPENVLIAKIGEMAVLGEMAELAVSRAYVDILIAGKIDAIGKPRVQLTKIAKNNPLEFKAVTAVVPEVKLPDYKNLADKEIAAVPQGGAKVTDKDVEDAIMIIRKQHSSRENYNRENNKPGEHEKDASASLPELTDDFVKTIGNFRDISDFKAKLSVRLAEDKENAAREKLRVKIADSIADKTDVEIPEIAIESELDRAQAQFSADIERMGVKLDDYLRHAKKSLEDIRKEWHPHAEKKAKLQLILNAIAAKEGIKPTREEIGTEVSHIVEHYKDADHDRAAIYAETILTNEKVFQVLERQNKQSNGKNTGENL